MSTANEQSASSTKRSSRPSYQQSVDEVLAALASDAQLGLSVAEARGRLEKYGKNELTAEKPVPAWRKFIAQFQDVLVILLLIATLISAGLWLYERESALPYEALAIFAVVLLNAIMGYAQQARAEQAVAALRQMSAARANVVRDGVQQSIPATGVVPGDILLIAEGDTVPADARLIQSTALQTAEAALTGESLPVAKDIEPISDEAGVGDRDNMIFSGTAVTYGHGKAVVVATGMQTEMGRIAGLLKEAPQETTPLQHELDRVGRLLGLIVIVIAVVMIATIILIEDVRGFAGLFDVLILGVALAVAAVPEGLPAVVTAVLAMGVQRMAKRNAIVRPSRRSGNSRLGERDCFRQDRHAHEERDDCARGRHGERACDFPGHGLRSRRRSKSRRSWRDRRCFAHRAGARSGRRRPGQQCRIARARWPLDGAGRSDRRRAHHCGTQSRSGG